MLAGRGLAPGPGVADCAAGGAYPAAKSQGESSAEDLKCRAPGGEKLPGSQDVTRALRPPRSWAGAAPPRADSPRPRRALRLSAGAAGPAASLWASFIGAGFKWLSSQMCSSGTSRFLCHCSHHAPTTPGAVLIKQSHAFQLCRKGA